MDTAPSDDELRAFIRGTLADVDNLLREPDIVDETIRDHRALWVMLYRVSRGSDPSDQPSG